MQRESQKLSHLDRFSNHVKNILHGFFLAIGTTIAEPSTILPLMVNYFGGSPVLIGFFAALLRGGAIVVQLFAEGSGQGFRIRILAQHQSSGVVIAHSHSRAPMRHS